MKLEITGYCWACGSQCKDLFCNEKCNRVYERREQQIYTKRHGKRENYGAKGV